MNPPSRCTSTSAATATLGRGLLGMTSGRRSVDARREQQCDDPRKPCKNKDSDDYHLRHGYSPRCICSRREISETDGERCGHAEVHGLRCGHELINAISDATSNE